MIINFHFRIRSSASLAGPKVPDGMFLPNGSLSPTLNPSISQEVPETITCNTGPHTPRGGDGGG